MAGTRREPGCLEPYVEGFRSRLLELGYADETVRIRLDSDRPLPFRNVRRFVKDRAPGGHFLRDHIMVNWR